MGTHRNHQREYLKGQGRETSFPEAINITFTTRSHTRLRECMLKFTTFNTKKHAGFWPVTFTEVIWSSWGLEDCPGAQSLTTTQQAVACDVCDGHKASHILTVVRLFAFSRSLASRRPSSVGGYQNTTRWLQVTWGSQSKWEDCTQICTTGLIIFIQKLMPRKWHNIFFLFFCFCFL